ncbi:MAG TPA: SpoIIE family protein phosphatase [Streptosporangiaceae bacterium]
MPRRDLRELLETERLRVIFDGTYEYIGFLAPDGTLLEANRASLEFAGTPREEVIGRPFWETVWFVHTPGAPEQLRQAVARAAAGETFRTEWALRRPSGEEVVFDFSLRPVLDEQGEVILIIPEGRDITDLKLAEEAARHQELRYQMLFERATDGIWLADQHGRFVDANPAACRMLGYTREQHVALTVDDVVRPEDLPRLGDLMSELAAGRQVTDLWDIRRADGSYISIELSHAYTPDGLWQATGRDVTERERQRQSEHEVAEVLQRSLLPTMSELDAWRLAVRYEPAVDVLEVGGDWYDAVALDSGRLAVAVGDVVGKGAAAAAVMGQLRSAARALLLQGHGPAEMLTALDAFARRIPGARCSTVFCALIDQATATVRYSSAGHPPAILDKGTDNKSQNSRPYVLLDGAQSTPLAVLDAVRRPQATMSLPPGSTLLLYTDGLVERRGQSIDVAIDAAAAILAGARAVSPAECADRLAARLIGRAHDDDVAFLIYRHLPPDGPAPETLAAEPVALTFPADLDELSGLRATLRSWFAQARIGLVAANELLHAIGEVTSNAIEHGSRLDPSRTVTISLACDDGVVRAVVSDSGRWIEPAADTGRGRGLRMTRALVDDMTVSATGTGTTVYLTKRIAAS